MKFWPFINKKETLEQRAVAGDPEAQYVLALEYKFGDGRDKDICRARELFECAAGQGYALSMRNLGMLYDSTNKDHPTDLVKAADYYRQAYEHGDPDGYYLLGIMKFLGKGCEKNNVEAFDFFTKAIIEGSDYFDVLTQLFSECVSQHKEARDMDLAHKILTFCEALETNEYHPLSSEASDFLERIRCAQRGKDERPSPPMPYNLAKWPDPLPPDLDKV